MLNQRRALLSYLRRSDFDAFCYVIHKLGLRDNNYAKQVCLCCVCIPHAQVYAMGPAVSHKLGLRDNYAKQVKLL